MIKTIIIDDEKNATKALEIAINEYCPQIEIIGIANSALDGIKEIQLKSPDLVFTDIEMPQMSGIELIEQFPNRKFDVIFVTAYNQYAVKAFKVAAVDYLLKPINIMELVQAVNKLADKKPIDAEEHNYSMARLKAALSGKLAIPASKGFEYLPLQEIIRIEADGSYSKIITIDNKTRMVSKNLKSFEEILIDDGFYRVHKSHLINLKYIKRFVPEKDGGFIEMTDNSVVLISREVKKDLSLTINKFTLNFKNL